jgi:oxygen-dependent protoporphyrinogen oxidase
VEKKAQRPSAIVVGAGIAGLAVAWRLARHGFAVRVLERSQRVGGRAAALREEGTCLEAVPQILHAGDRRLLAWIGEVGLRDELLPLRPLVASLAWRGGLREVEVTRLADVRRVPGVRWWEALRLIRLPRLLARYRPALDLDAPERAAPLDDRSVADFCRLYFGASVLEQWIAPRLLAGSLADAQETSRAQLLLELHAWRLARPGLARAPLAEVAERAAAALPVTLGAEAVSLTQPRGGLPRVELREGSALEADAVVLAVPAPEARRIAAPLLTSAESDGLDGIRYAPGITVAALLCRPLRARPQLVLVPRGESSPLACALIEPGLLAGRVADSRGLLLLRATPGFAASHFDAPSETLAKDLLGAFESFWPGAQRSVERASVLREPYAAPRFDVGRYRQIARWERGQREARAEGRRVYFAADYLIHPSFEGALASAERCAAAVTEDLGRRTDSGAG